MFSFYRNTDSLNNIFCVYILNILSIPMVVLFISSTTILSKPLFPDLNRKYYALFAITDYEYFKYEFSRILKRVEVDILAIFPLCLLISLGHYYQKAIILAILNIVLLNVLLYFSILIKNYYLNWYWALIQSAGLSFIFATHFFYKYPDFQKNFSFFLLYTLLLILLCFVGILVVNKKQKVLFKSE